MAVGGAGMTTGVRAGDCGVAGRPRAPAVCVAGCAAAHIHCLMHACVQRTARSAEVVIKGLPPVIITAQR
jgi:hypothetical protein